MAPRKTAPKATTSITTVVHPDAKPVKRTRKAAPKKAAASTGEKAAPPGYFWENGNLVDIHRDLFHQTLAAGQRWNGPPTDSAR